MTEVLGNLAAFFALIGILGAAFVIGRASSLRATIKDQKERIDALDGLNATKDRELTDDRAHTAALEARLVAVEAKAYDLSEIVSGRVDYSALETIAAAYHAEIMRAITDIEASIHDMKKLLEAKRVGDQRER
jgi:hypothetical protein